MSINLRFAASPNGRRNVYDLAKDLVIDYSGDPTGVVDIGPKLQLFNTDGQSKNSFLRIPGGSYNWQANGTTWINGIKDLTVDATGAFVAGNGVFFQTRHVQQAGLASTTGGADGTGGKSARIQTVNAGANSVSLTSASAAAGYISRFSVGQRVMITGWPIQSLFQAPNGFPPNWGWVEHVTITGIVGNTISFTPSLNNYYDQNWPELNSGNNNETDAAGPASIIGIDPFWIGTTTVIGGTFNRSNLINCYRENFIINGVTCTGLPMYPSVNKLYRAINCIATAALTEHDKLNDTVDIQGGSYGTWKCQSSSTRLLTMTGVTMAGLDGTVGDTVLDVCTVNGNLTAGPIAYGRALSLLVKKLSHFRGDWQWLYRERTG
jgi:hypothetical protein